MPKRLITLVMAFVVLTLTTGCSAIHSGAVRDLIHKEGATIDRAQTNIDLFEKQTEDRIKFLEEALKELNEAGKSLQQVEALHHVVFSSYQNIERKRGQDAHSAAYLLGRLYLAQYEGLQKRVNDQFHDDFCALREVAARLGDSWKSLATLHQQLRRYAEQSVFASVDPQLVAALMEQAPGSSDHLTRVLQTSRSVNDALDEALNFSFLRGRTLESTRSLTMDLVELLERVKKD
jgi:hypothetical protein